MARKCEVTGKGPMVGNNVSHANNKTKRRFLPNLQYRRFWVESENRWVRLRVSNAALRLIDKNGIMLPDDALISLVKRLISEEDIYYGKILGRNNVAVRVAPMLGLMGTLIPLGPGIAALGTGDLASLSSSLIIAFDTTVAGLAAAAVCLIVSKIRKSWYENYMTALESGMATMVQKINDLVKEGRLTVEQPSDYAFLYQAALKRADASVPAVAPVPATD